MEKLKWERNYGKEGILWGEWWSAKWWVVWLYVYSQDGCWHYLINGGVQLRSKMQYPTKEDAFDAVEEKIESVCRDIIYPATADSNR